MVRSHHSSPFLPPSASLHFLHSSVLVSASQRDDIDVSFLAENSAIILITLLTYVSLLLGGGGPRL